MYIQEINIIIGLTNILSGVIILLLSILLKNGLIYTNTWYGFQFENLQSSDKKLRIINMYGSERFIIWSLPLILIGIISFYLPFEESIILAYLLSFTPIILLIPTYESYIFSKFITTQHTK